MILDLIYNLNALKNILKRKYFLVEKIYVFNINKRNFLILKMAIELGINVKYVNSFTYHFFLKTFNLLTKIKYYSYNIDFNFIFLRKRKILMLYNVQDPHNLAACIRSAEVFDFDFVIVTKKNSAKINTLIHNVSQATSLLLPVFIFDNFKQLVFKFKKKYFKIICLSVKSKKNISKTFNNKLSFVFILGSEKYGIKKSLLNKSEVYKIKTLGLSKSLNVSVATSIVIYYA